MDTTLPPPHDPQSLAVGDIVDGRFRVERIIGEGAIGIVVEATHLELGQRIAIKVLRPTERTRKEQVVRFAREARAVARLKGEHIARVYDVGELPDGGPYMSMELLEGRDLEQHIEKHGPILNLATAVLYVIQACEALAEAHAVGIVHRDIKPANLFLVDRPGNLPMIKLLDFGISKAALTGEYTNVALDETKTTTIMGTPYYMSPEQVRSTKDVDGRADIWALGAVLFEILSGATVWRSDDLGTLVQEILHGEPREIFEKRPDLPEAFAAVLSGALERDPSKRYGTAAEFARALLPFAPPTALVHVERAERFITTGGLNSTKGSLPSLRTAIPKSLSSTSVPVEADAFEPTARSRVAVFTTGISALLFLGGITAIVAPRVLTRRVDPPTTTAPAASFQGEPVPVAAISLAATKPSASAASPHGGGTPTPSATDRAAAAQRWGVQPRPSKVDASAPVAADPPATRGKKQALDDNPWKAAGKPTIDDPFK